MALRTTAADLVRLLDRAGAPVYLLDDERRMVFVNDACAAWAGCAAADLLGQEARYHTSAEVTGPPGIVAALSPPPEVWTGRRVTATVTLTGLDAKSVSRQVEFIPLPSSATEVAGVIGVASVVALPEHATDNPESAADHDELSPRELHDRLARWRRQLAGRYHVDRMLGPSPAMRQVRNQVQLAAAGVGSVSIVGPPGSGRQHVARAIHYGRVAAAAGPFVPLACPLLSMSLLESTIHALTRDHAATTARQPATLFLSDVDQLEAEVQEPFARLLAKLATVRVVSTSRESLSTLASAQQFRGDLACAMATVEIRLPSLTDRLEDLPLLAQMLVEECNRQGKKQIAGLTPEALDRLAAYRWPENVRELAEVVSVAHRAAEGSHIIPADLPAKIQIALEAAARPRKREPSIVLEKFLAEIEEELIRRAMDRAKGNKTKAARLLGMTRPRLYRRLVQLGLAEAEDGPPDTLAE